MRVSRHAGTQAHAATRTTLAQAHGYTHASIEAFMHGSKQTHENTCLFHQTIIKKVCKKKGPNRMPHSRRPAITY